MCRQGGRAPAAVAAAAAAAAASAAAAENTAATLCKLDALHAVRRAARCAHIVARPLAVAIRRAFPARHASPALVAPIVGRAWRLLCASAPEVCAARRPCRRRACRTASSRVAGESEAAKSASGASGPNSDRAAATATSTIVRRLGEPRGGVGE